MTYTVSSGALNSCIPYHLIIMLIEYNTDKVEWHSVIFPLFSALKMASPDTIILLIVD